MSEYKVTVWCFGIHNVNLRHPIFIFVGISIECSTSESVEYYWVVCVGF